MGTSTTPDSHSAMQNAETIVLNEMNDAQKTLLSTFFPFFTDIHQMLKTIDKKVREYEKTHQHTKESKLLKTNLAALHRDLKAAEQYFSHIHWLQERFPKAAYEDVTGLCKLASLDEVKEQEYSLNPGRYVGVVIEEDGKTEEEFIEEILTLNTELEQLNAEAKELETVIGQNIRLIVGEE